MGDRKETDRHLVHRKPAPFATNLAMLRAALLTGPQAPAFAIRDCRNIESDSCDSAARLGR